MLAFRNRRRSKGRATAHIPSFGLTGEKARFVVFCIFVAGVFLMGGGSRADILSLVVLRPFAVVVGAYALFLAKPEDLRRVRWPLIMLGLLALLMLAQLIPLPQSVWEELPGRALYAQIQADAGLDNTPRPLTLSPSRTVNSLMSLVVPLATVLMLSILGPQSHRKVLFVIAAAGAVSAVWAVAQVAGPSHGPLYTYHHTNNGFPVGPFANRNHLALLLAILLVLIGYICRRLIFEGAMRPFYTAVYGTGALVVLALVLVAGSRAGLGLAVAAVPLASWLAYGAYKEAHGTPSSKVKLIFVLAIGVAVAGIVALTIFYSQATSIDRLSHNSAFADNRAERLPLVLEMLRHHWLAGIGFGAFEGVFQSYETTDVLTPFIFNQAHSDWLQVIIEGGVPAALLLVVAVAWVAREGIRVLGWDGSRFDATGFVALSILGLSALASVVDYPVRTPIMMFICATSFTLLAQHKYALYFKRQQPRNNA